MNPSTPRISPASRGAILFILNGLVDSVTKQYGGAKPTYDVFAKKGKKEKPFLYALFPDIVRPSEIERSTSGKMGNAVRDVAKQVALGAGHRAEIEYVVHGAATGEVIDYINKLVRPKRGKEKPEDPADITKEMETIRVLNAGSKAEHDVTIDLFVESQGEEYYFDLKTPQPNADQPREMKSKLMRARALRLPKDVHGHAVFYYNPKGLEGKHVVAPAYLDHAGGEVLVGKDFWDMLAGPGTYEELIELIQAVGLARQHELRALI